MQCPLCRQKTLQTSDLECGLQAMRCGQCGGQWVKSFEYWRWREKRARTSPEKSPGGEMPQVTEDSDTAMVCPECGKILSRFKVGHGVSFYLDHCGHCGGTWFDKNEWSILESSGLHTDVHFIFSAAWQAELRREEREAFRRKTLEELLGGEHYRELTTLKSWLDGHPHREVALAFLLGKSPTA